MQLIAYIKSLAARDRDDDGATGIHERANRECMITAAAPERENYLNAGYGIRSWLLTTDHKRIALLYLVSITLFFFVGGVFAALIRLELLTPAGRPGQRGDLQQAVHHARRDHGLLLPDPVDPGRARQLPGAA